MVADADDVDAAPFGDGDEEGAKLDILPFEDRAQLQPEIWPEYWQYVGVEAGDLGCHAWQYKSAGGGVDTIAGCGVFVGDGRWISPSGVFPEFAEQMSGIQVGLKKAGARSSLAAKPG